MTQLVPDQRLAHETCHARLHLRQLLLILVHLALGERSSARTPILLQQSYLVILDQLEEVEFGALWHRVILNCSCATACDTTITFCRDLIWLLFGVCSE